MSHPYAQGQPADFSQGQSGLSPGGMTASVRYEGWWISTISERFKQVPFGECGGIIDGSGSMRGPER
jgi:hypothetical protein